MIACIDFFCGVGGLTHGLVRGGVKVVAGVDVDPLCKYPYEANNEAKFIEQDVKQLSATDLLPLWPKKSVTMLAGCAPCQPFSTYSRRGRMERADAKWELAKEFGRLINQLQPKLVTMENVPQLADHSVFKDFTKSLKGYNLWHGIVECSKYGVPQTRKRLVLLASKLGPISLAKPSIDESHPPTVRSAITGLLRLKAGEYDSSDYLHWACKLSPLNLKRIKASKPGGTWRDWDESLISECHKKDTGETYPSVYGRMEWDKPSPTITTQCFGYGNGRFGHPEQNRAITLREAAILQTFPKGYKFLPKGELPTFAGMGRLIGNAVPVRLGEVIAQTVVAHVADHS